MNRQTVLLLFGGESSEHDVSVSSARNVYAALDDTKYIVLLGYIDHHGRWWLLENFGESIVTHGAPQLLLVPGAESFITMPHSRVITPDVILPVLHGKNGEDGSVQGLAQLLHIPIVGSDMVASAICMDKIATKRILEANKIRVARYTTHASWQELPDFNKLSMQFGSPLFVKPSRAGSSFGVSKVYSEEELEAALAAAHRYDELALIEAAVSGRELEVGILGNPPYHQASVAGEVKTEDFYTYDAKYSPGGGAKIIIPAELEEATTQRIRELALNVYELLGCKGLARVDFFLQDDGVLIVNEINTLPGFTSSSVYPKLWRQEGLSYSQLIERLLSLATERKMKKETEE